MKPGVRADIRLKLVWGLSKLPFMPKLAAIKADLSPPEISLPKNGI